MKTPVSESLFNKVAGLRPTTLLKRDSDVNASCGYILKDFDKVFIVSLFDKWKTFERVQKLHF